MRMTFEVTIPFLVIHSIEIHICLKIFIAILFVIVNTRKLSKSLSLKVP